MYVCTSKYYYVIAIMFLLGVKVLELNPRKPFSSYNLTKLHMRQLTLRMPESPITVIGNELRLFRDKAFPLLII